MNPEAVEVLKRILAKEPRELTSDDIAFLKARWTYVGKNSRVKFADVVKGNTEKVEDDALDEEEEKKDETVDVDPFAKTQEDEVDEE